MLGFWHQGVCQKKFSTCVQFEGPRIPLNDFCFLFLITEEGASAYKRDSRSAAQLYFLLHFQDICCEITTTVINVRLYAVIIMKVGSLIHRVFACLKLLQTRKPSWRTKTLRKLQMQAFYVNKFGKTHCLNENCKCKPFTCQQISQNSMSIGNVFCT